MSGSSPEAADLQSILPRPARAAELLEADPPLPGRERQLRAGELAAVQGASERRRREFAAGRACARRALELIGVAATAIPMGEDGAPRWPAGVVGSITHKGAYRGAAVACARDLAGLGVDAELDEPLPPGVLARIALAAEFDAVQRLLHERPGLAWDRLLFSAKEAAVKAGNPLGLGQADLRSTEIVLDASARSFTARLGLGSASTSERELPAVSGRWLVLPGMLLVAGSLQPAR